MKLTLLFSKRWLWLNLLLVLVSGLLLWLSVTRWLPLPPTTMVMAGALPSGSYIATAVRYRDVLEPRGIQVETITTEGAAEPLNRLLERKYKVDAGFAQGLLAKPNMNGVHALAAVERSPIWIFTSVPTVNELAQLKGLRIATPNTGNSNTGNSGWEMTQLLLQHVRLTEKDVTLVATKSHAETAAALIEHRADAVVLNASGDDESVRLLSRAPGVHLIGVERVATLTAREPRLIPFVLPQGAIELRGDIPPNDVAMVGTNLQLLVTPDTHPALQRVLLDAGKEIHETAGFLQRQGEFPNIRDIDFVLSPVAKDMANGERPWIERVLPYWWAQLAELICYAVVPILLMTTFLLIWIPNLFKWKINAVLQNFYGELKFLENDIEPTASNRPIEMRKLLQRLDEIEAKVRALDLPNSHADRWYTLREHIAGARSRLLNLRER
jgi:TRAP-type uncharacterized transport system substrate-binding protein